MNPTSSFPKPIDELPAQTVRRLGALDVDGLRSWAAQAGHRFVLAECSDCVDKGSLLKAIGRAFAFPDWYGNNLDALYDCLTDLPERGDRARFAAGHRALEAGLALQRQAEVARAVLEVAQALGHRQAGELGEGGALVVSSVSLR